MANASLKRYGSKVPTTQDTKIPGKKMVKASDKKTYVFKADSWTRLNRFLILGTEGGSYYAGEAKLTFKNLENVEACIQEDGLRVVSIVVDISESGRAPKNDQALFVLAMCASTEDDKTRAAALEALPRVARTGTHLFQFVTYVEQFRSWGRGLRKAIGRWYTDKSADDLAFQVVKYRSRRVEGEQPWSHVDLLRKVHIGAKDHTPFPDERPDAAQFRAVIEWLASEAELTPKKIRKEVVKGLRPEVTLPDPIVGFRKVQKAKTPEKAAKIVAEYRLPWEAIPSEFLNSPVVRDALLTNMPIGALVRQLATMTRTGYLTPTSGPTQIVAKKLVDPEAVRKSRIHPLNVLMAMKTYAHGESIRGTNTWAPLPKIVDALDELFYLSFGNVEPTGLRRCIALDVSGSMSGKQSYNKGRSGFVPMYSAFADIAGYPGLSPREAAAAMAMVSMKTGDPYEVVAFTAPGSARGTRFAHYEALPQVYDGLSVMPFSARQRLDDICAHTERIWPGGTDLSLPMRYAKDMQREFDVFEVYTDNETNTWDQMHPSQALEQYRKSSGIDAKLVVVGMVANKFTIADPSDPGMLDVAGFDSATPQLISAFAEGGF